MGYTRDVRGVLYRVYRDVREMLGVYGGRRWVYGGIGDVESARGCTVCTEVGVRWMNE